MHLKTVLCALTFCAGMALFAAVPALADDSAASIAAGGLVARRETRIVMAKEILQISPDKIVVDYDFRNDTDQDVTTEVAFPVPPYSYGPESPDISDASFSDFKLLVDGKTVAYQTEAKATLNGKDVTAILTADKIDIASFGHIRQPDPASGQMQTPDVSRLPQAEQQRLATLGLFDAEDGWGLWTVNLQVPLDPNLSGPLHGAHPASVHAGRGIGADADRHPEIRLRKQAAHWRCRHRPSTNSRICSVCNRFARILHF